MTSEALTFHDQDLPVEQQSFIEALNLRQLLKEGGTPEEIERLERELAYFQTIEQWVNDPKNFIDTGGAGNVYGFDKIRLCIKIMKNYHNDPHKERFDLGNNALVEARFLREVDGLEVSGVRAPAPVQVVAGDHVSAIIMERLNATNMQHIINGSAAYPESFEYDKFADGVRDYLDVLHTDRQIVHGDLFVRNLMVNNETGSPYMIDFGRSKMTGALDIAEEKKLQDNDWQRLENSLTQIKDHHAAFAPLSR